MNVEIKDGKVIRKGDGQRSPVRIASPAVCALSLPPEPGPQPTERSLLLMRISQFSLVYNSARLALYRTAS